MCCCSNRRDSSYKASRNRFFELVEAPLGRKTEGFEFVSFMEESYPAASEVDEDAAMKFKRRSIEFCLDSFADNDGC